MLSTPNAAATADNYNNNNSSSCRGRGREGRGMAACLTDWHETNQNWNVNGMKGGAKKAAEGEEEASVCPKYIYIFKAADMSILWYI